MKKSLLSSIFFTTTLTCSSAFAGVFVQGGIGAKYTEVKTEDQLLTSISQTNKVTGADFSMGVGYAFETQSNFKPAIIVAGSLQTGSSSEEARGVFQSYTSKVSKLGSFDIYGQLGYQLNEKSMVYANLGFAIPFATVERSVGVGGFADSLKDSSSELGGLVGFGYELRQSQNLAFFGEGNFRYAKTDQDDETVGVEKSSFGVLIGARYYF